MLRTIRFDAVDVLHLGHFITTKDGLFDFGVVDRSKDGVGKGTIAKRFEHIVKVARSMNPNIEILVEQMYSGGEGFDNLEKWDDAAGKIDEKATLAMVDKYTSSVRDFLQTWQAKPNGTYNGKSISMRIDGYDCDHEGTTVRECTKDVLSQLRTKLNALTEQDTQKRPFIIGLTPARSDAFLDKSMAKSCDIINMQRYSGGKWTMPEAYLDAIDGLVPGKLTYGIEIETLKANSDVNDTIEKLAKIPAMTVRGGKLRGLWTWRLGSNRVFENLMQVWLYNTVNGTKLEVNGKVPDATLVKAEWKKNGGH